MISIQGVTKKYGKFKANDDIDFTVQDSQIAVLLGPNGAGKSTLIKCITGLLRFEGLIEIDGHNNKSIEAKKLLGYIPEMPAVYDITPKNSLKDLKCLIKKTSWAKSFQRVCSRSFLLSVPLHTSRNV